MPVFTIGEMILRSLFGRPATRMYPAVRRDYAEGSRGHIEVAIDECIFCGLCQRRCPSQALSVNREAREWEIDRLRCVSCNFCVEVCPKNCLAIEKGYSAAASSREPEKHHA
ncbi:MAG: 4Fe-4S dicluster domain-containing protein [Deltaproteobacteria bacterium]|nr:4Fe-4S dicluster domain-containing protein [Deltaproteobacteria bacterium]